MQSDFDINDIGKILWLSKNSKSLLKIEEHNIANQNINKFIPDVFSQYHDKILTAYYNRGYSSFIHSLHDLWMYDHNTLLFLVQLYTKVYFDKNRLTFMSFIRKENEYDYLLLNDRGEIDSFGKNFSLLSRLDNKFVATQKNIPIFLFLPQLIPFFLSYFYDLPNYQMKNFNLENFKSTFLFMYKDVEKMCLDLNQRLKKTSSKMEYCQCLYKFLNDLDFEDVEQVFKVDFNIESISYRKSPDSIMIWELKVEHYIDVTAQFKKNYFKSQFYFLKKIKFDDSMIYSIEKYEQRQEENNLFKQDSSFIQEFSNAKPNLKTEINSGVFLADGKAKPIIKSSSNRKNIKDTIIDDINRKRATEIIKKLFIKKFNPRGSIDKMSTNTQKWVNVINKYISNKNKVVDNFINLHIEDLDDSFKQDYFFCSKLMKFKTKKEYIQLFNIEKEKRTEDFLEGNNSSYISSTSKTQDLNSSITKNKIKQNHKIKQKNLNIIFYIFLVAIVIWSFMIYFAYVVNIYRKDRMINMNITGNRLEIFKKFSYVINTHIRVRNMLLKEYINKAKQADSSEGDTVADQKSTVEYDNLTLKLIEKTSTVFNKFFKENFADTVINNDHIYSQLIKHYNYYSSKDVRTEISTLNFMRAINFSLSKDMSLDNGKIEESIFEINKEIIWQFLMDMKDSISDKYKKDYNKFLDNRIPLITW